MKMIIPINQCTLQMLYDAYENLKMITTIGDGVVILTREE